MSARLENWYFDGERLHGHVFGHPLAPRRPDLWDGSYVYTSEVVEWGDGVPPAWAQTRNTRYELGAPQPERGTHE